MFTSKPPVEPPCDRSVHLFHEWRGVFPSIVVVRKVTCISIRKPVGGFCLFFMRLECFLKLTLVPSLIGVFHEHVIDGTTGAESAYGGLMIPHDDHAGRCGEPRQVQCHLDGLAVFHHVADVAGTDAEAFRHDYTALAGDDGVLKAQMKISPSRILPGFPAFLRAFFLKEIVHPLLVIGDKHQTKRGFDDHVLMVTQIGKLLPERWVLHVNDGIERHIPRGRGAENSLKNQIAVFLRNRAVLIGPHASPGEQKGTCFHVHTLMIYKTICFDYDGYIMKSVRAYRYRWLILLALVLLVFAVEIQWMAFSPIGRIANKFYEAAWTSNEYSVVDLMSFIYMGGFVLFAIPASLLINKTGICRSLRFASLLVILGSVAKVFQVDSPVFMLLCQVVMACAQAIILCLETVTVARWFPIRERGMAVGIISACQYIALAFVMVFSPYLIRNGSFPRLVSVYGGISFLFAIIGALIIKENPPTPSSMIEPADESYVKALFTIGKIKSLRGLITVFAVSWGVLMAMLVKIDFIASELELDSTAWFGLTLMISGAIGAIVVPALSDTFKKRKVFFVGCFGLCLPGLLLVCFSTSGAMSFAGAAIFGFFAFSAIPIGLQYAAELGFPLHEEIVQSHMVFFSQGLGALILLFTMSDTILELRHLISFFIALLLACFAGSTFIGESTMIVTEEERLGKEINKEIVQTE